MGRSLQSRPGDVDLPDAADVGHVDAQVFISTGIADAVSAARQAAAGKDVCLMGSGMVAAALDAGLLDEVTLHQVPVSLGGGTPNFRDLPSSVPLTPLQVVPAPGVTHLRFAVDQ